MAGAVRRSCAGLRMQVGSVRSRVRRQPSQPLSVLELQFAGSETTLQPSDWAMEIRNHAQHRQPQDT